MKPIELIEMPSAFHKMRSINVNDHTEKKNGLTYLSWAWAVDQLLQNDPQANWEYLEPLMFGETMMVRCAVTAFGKTMVSQLPVMNYKNQPIQNPDAFQVNTAMQRCLAKAIALHGLGLYIYAGEDVPEDEKDQKVKATKITPMEAAKDEAVQKLLDDPQEFEYLQNLAAELVQLAEIEKKPELAYIHAQKHTLTNDEKLALWDILKPNSKTRAAIKNKPVNLAEVA